jgi:hypothetical protein
MRTDLGVLATYRCRRGWRTLYWFRPSVARARPLLASARNTRTRWSCAEENKTRPFTRQRRQICLVWTAPSSLHDNGPKGRTIQSGFFFVILPAYAHQTSIQSCARKHIHTQIRIYTYKQYTKARRRLVLLFKKDLPAPGVKRFFIFPYIRTRKHSSTTICYSFSLPLFLILPPIGDFFFFDIHFPSHVASVHVWFIVARVCGGRKNY